MEFAIGSAMQHSLERGMQRSLGQVLFGIYAAAISTKPQSHLNLIIFMKLPPGSLTAFYFRALYRISRSNFHQYCTSILLGVALAGAQVRVQK